MIDEVFFNLTIYIRLISYPLIALGLAWLALLRDDWKQRPMTKVYFSFAALMMVQMVAAAFRLFDPNYTLVVIDFISTPVLMIVTFSVWAAALRISRLDARASA